MAVAAAMFASCSENEVLNVATESAPAEIAFETYAGKVTRAENSSQTEKLTLDQHQTSFKVWAAKQLNNASWVGVYKDAQTVTWSSGLWNVTNTKYWDKSASKYLFYAAAPASANWGYDVNGSADDYSDDYLTLLGVTLAGTDLSTALSTVAYQHSWLNAGGDVDYLIATDKEVLRPFYTAAPPIGKVNLEFNHILSRLNITVKKGGKLLTAGDEVVVTGLEVRNLLKAGNFNEGVNIVGDPLVEGTTERWTTTGEKYTITGKGYTMSSEPAYLLQALVIPQVATYQPIDRNGSTSTEHPYVYITYTINEEPYAAAYNLAHVFVGEQNLAFCEGWQNTLNITIDADAIEFTGDVFKWADDVYNGIEFK